MQSKVICPGSKSRNVLLIWLDSKACVLFLRHLIISIFWGETPRMEVPRALLQSNLQISHEWSQGFHNPILESQRFPSSQKERVVSRFFKGNASLWDPRHTVPDVAIMKVFWRFTLFPSINLASAVEYEVGTFSHGNAEWDRGGSEM